MYPPLLVSYRFSCTQPHFSPTFTQSLKSLPKVSSFYLNITTIYEGDCKRPLSPPFSAEPPLCLYTPSFFAPHPSPCETRMLHNLAKCIGKILKDIRTTPEE